MAFLSTPTLHRSQLKFRIELARRRCESFPLDSLDFIMMDLERPDLATHHSYWCTPLTYYWNVENQVPDGTVPENYTAPSLPAGRPCFESFSVQSDGFLDLQREPIRDFSYFEEGPQARLGIQDASVNVPMLFENGQKKDLFFWPLCEATSNLALYDVPMVFPAIDSRE